MDLLIIVCLLTIGGVGLCCFLMARRAPPDAGRSAAKQEAVDTVAAWPPQGTRIMTLAENKAYQMLRTALPQHTVLAQVPLSRFMKVPTRYSYSEWLRRVGLLSVDLLVCDASSQVLAAIEIRGDEAIDPERARQRHERMDRVLKAAGLPVHVWNEQALPDPSQVRALFSASREADPPSFDSTSPAATRPGSLAASLAASAQAAAPWAFSSPAAEVDLLLEPPTPASPAALQVDLLLEDAPARRVAEVDLLLDAEEDPRRRDRHQRRDPPPSTWFDDLDSGALPLHTSQPSRPARFTTSSH